MAEKMTRFELAVPEGMRAWMKSAARMDGLTESGYLRHLIAADLTGKYGPVWHDPSDHDHPEGDHEEDPLVAAGMVMQYLAR